MRKLPRDLSGVELIKRLEAFGCQVTRQTSWLIRHESLLTFGRCSSFTIVIL
jgi:hypothetical protein